MRRSRWLLPILALGALFAVCIPSVASPSSDRRAVITAERDALLITDGGEAVVEYTLAEWRGWAEENLIAALGEPVSIGPYEQAPSSFNTFGAAQLSPNGERLALSTSAYAVLTTVSVVGILGIADNELKVIAEPAFGGVQDFLWSPDARFLAYPLDTARATGDKLRVDNVPALLPVIELDGEDLLEVVKRSGQEVTTDPRQWLPKMRDLEWDGGDRLRFTTNGLEEGELHWTLAPQAGELSLE